MIGHEIYGAGIVIGLVFAAFGLYLAHDREASLRTTVITAGVCFLIPYLLGRAALYWMAGE